MNTAKHYEAKVLAMGGDGRRQACHSVIREANGRYRAHLMGKTKRLEGHTDMQGFWSKNRDMEPMVSGGFREIGAVLI